MNNDFKTFARFFTFFFWLSTVLALCTVWLAWRFTPYGSEHRTDGFIAVFAVAFMIRASARDTDSMREWDVSRAYWRVLWASWAMAFNVFGVPLLMATDVLDASLQSAVMLVAIVMLPMIVEFFFKR